MHLVEDTSDAPDAMSVTRSSREPEPVDRRRSGDSADVVFTARRHTIAITVEPGR